MSVEEELRRAVGAVTEPLLGRTLENIKAVRGVSIENQAASVAVELPVPGYAAADQLKSAIQAVAKSRAPDLSTIDVRITCAVKGKQSGGNVGLKVKNVIAVGSGKGGVGKSTVAACLAYGLHKLGASTGLMDADVYGPSIPHLVGASGQPAIRQYQNPDGRMFERIEPIEAHGVKLISMGFMVAPDQAVIWRGPMLHKALTQFLQQTDWGELDYLVVDMPPGTGDVALTLSQMVSLAGAVVVCTPQQVALLDAGKAITMFNTVKIPILGMVENMSGELFGRGGAKARAESSGIPFLGEIPSNPIIRIRGDEGRIPALFDEDSPVREPLLALARTTSLEVARKLFDQPSLPTLELL